MSEPGSFITVSNEIDNIVLTNGLISACIDTTQGADITSLIHLASDKEVLWRAESTKPSSSDGAAGFYESYRGGVQDLFPNAGPETLVEGTPLPFHGEARRTTWSVISHPDNLTLELEARLPRYPFKLYKHIRLDPNTPTLKVTTEVTNASAVGLPVHWGFHPAFGEAVTQSPAEVIGAFEWLTPHIGPFGSSRTHTKLSDLPAGRSGVTHLLLNTPESATADLDYATASEGWFIVRSETTGLGVVVTWPVELFGSVWIWQECQDRAGFPWFGRHHIVGVEPHTSAPAQELSKDVQDGLAVLVGPGETLSATFGLQVGIITTAELPQLIETLSPRADRVEGNR